MTMDAYESLDDLMEATFDFDGLSLESPKEEFGEAHIQVQTENEQLFPQNESATLLLTTLPPPSLTQEKEGGTDLQELKIESGTEAASQPWAKIPSPSERNPYMPGINAEKLDAMAMDPHHILKSRRSVVSTTSTTHAGKMTLGYSRKAGADESSENGSGSAVAIPTSFTPDHKNKSPVPGLVRDSVAEISNSMIGGWTGDPSWLLSFSSPTSAIVELDDAPDILTAVDTHFESSSMLSHQNLHVSRLIGQQQLHQDEAKARQETTKTTQRQSIGDRAYDEEMEEAQGLLWKSALGSNRMQDSTGQDGQSEAGNQGVTFGNSSFSFSFGSPSFASVVSVADNTKQKAASTSADSSLPASFQAWRNFMSVSSEGDYGFDDEHDIERVNNVPPKIAMSKSFAPALYQRSSSDEKP